MDGFLATLVFAAGIAAVIILTSKFKIQPFLVLFFVALAVGLASGLPPESMGGIVTEGFSKVLGYTAIITVSALIIGVVMQQTGAVFVISKAILGLLGKGRSHVAMGIIGYIVAYPVQCCDTSFIMLSPLLQSLTAGGGLDMMVYVLTLSAGAFVSYAMLFPSAPLLSVTLLGADIGKVLILGFAASIPALIVGLIVAEYLGKRNKLNVDASGAKTLDEIGAQYGKLPGMASVAAVIVVPTLIIIGRSVLSSAKLPLLDFVGNPVIALPLGAVLSILLLARDKGIKEINGMVAEGVNKSANVLMIVGAGSVLALVLQSLETWEETIPVKLTVFPENILRHEYDEADPTQDQKMRVASAIEMPGPETDAIAGMAKKWNTYVVASLHERIPEFPDYFFNTAFIMNPKGKIILKYRKINPWIPLELSTSPHDVLDGYKEPLFPVAKTELGNLACMVCYDQFFPEVARQLAFNGAEVICKPTVFPPYPQELNYDPYDWYTTVNKMRSIENMVYTVNANEAKYGGSMIVDFMGRAIAVADKGRQMTIGSVIDVGELREYRKTTKLHNTLQQSRNECYTYLQKPMWPKNKPLLKKVDYPAWAPKPKFYEEP